MFLVIHKMLINIKSFNSFFFFFLWFTYIGLLVFYTKLTHLRQKLKKFRLDETYVEKLNSN